jgi:glycosyltransferase involved in cell wall biosynthesis
LKEAVSSALSQAYPNIEILIGHDGENETIQSWATALANCDSRVRYQRNEQNLGLAGNWNALAEAARGEFLVIIGDDDRLLPDFVSTLVVLLKSSGDVAFSNHFVIDSSGDRLKTQSQQITQQYHRHELQPGEIANPAVCVWQNSIPMSAALVRTRAVRRLRFKEDLNTPEIELFARLAQEGGRFFFTPEYLAEYRVHDQSATTAGLRGENLVKHLASIDVSDEVEPYKRKFMESLLVDSVSRSLKKGNRELARQFLRHEYYPRLLFNPPGRNPKRAQALLPSNSPSSSNDGKLNRLLAEAITEGAQRFCSFLPRSLGSSAYRLLQTTKSRLLSPQ